MLILESKEELLKQLTEAWQIITQADEALEQAAQRIQQAHTNLRNFSRGLHDAGTIHRQDGTHASSTMATEKSHQTRLVQTMPFIRK